MTATTEPVTPDASAHDPVVQRDALAERMFAGLLGGMELLAPGSGWSSRR
ncbi:MAG: hypothetical protein ACRDRP_10625 [Pseudonocardiaceae bacterium]